MTLCFVALVLDASDDDGYVFVTSSRHGAAFSTALLQQISQFNFQVGLSPAPQDARFIPRSRLTVGDSSGNGELVK